MKNLCFIWGQLLRFSCMFPFSFPFFKLLNGLHFLTWELWLLYSRCDEKALEDSLCKRIIATRDENIVKTLDPEAAKGSRDALAKTVYSRLFDWWACFKDFNCLLFLFKNSFMANSHTFPLILICSMTSDLRLVNKINNSIGQDPNSKCLIGVLDIYGFESFKTNRCLIGMLLMIDCMLDALLWIGCTSREYCWSWAQFIFSKLWWFLLLFLLFGTQTSLVTSLYWSFECSVTVCLNIS